MKYRLDKFQISNGHIIPSEDLIYFHINIFL